MSAGAGGPEICCWQLQGVNSAALRQNSFFSGKPSFALTAFHGWRRPTHIFRVTSLTQSQLIVAFTTSTKHLHSQQRLD